MSRLSWQFRQPGSTVYTNRTVLPHGGYVGVGVGRLGVPEGVYHGCGDPSDGSKHRRTKCDRPAATNCSETHRQSNKSNNGDVGCSNVFSSDVGVGCCEVCMSVGYVIVIRFGVGAGCRHIGYVVVGCMHGINRGSGVLSILVLSGLGVPPNGPNV